MWTRSIAAICAASAVTLAGCATVTSGRHDGAAAAEGVTYFLPTRWARLTATRTLTDLPAAQRAVDAARIAHAAALQEREAAKVAHDALLADQTHASDPALRTAYQGDVDKAAAKLRAAENRLERLRGVLQTAEATATEIEARGAKCTFAAKVELMPSQADPAFRFVALPRHNILRDDTATLRVTPAGLLSSANAVAVDRTGDVIVELAGAAGAFGGVDKQTLTAEETAVQCASLPRQVVQVFDPVTDEAAVNTALETASFPIRIRVALPPTAPTRPTTAAAVEPRLREDANGALYYRTPTPVLLTIVQQHGAGWLPVDAAILALPQAGPVSYIPMNSAAFVRTANDVSFSDGVIASWTNERPSELLEVVRLPVKVAQALISVPAQLLQLRVNYSSQAEALAAGQQGEIEARERLLALQTCVAAGGEDIVERCLETD